MKEHLKSMLQSIINNREEDAAVQIHDYFVAKTRDVAGLGSTLEEGASADTIESIVKKTLKSGDYSMDDRDGEYIQIIFPRSDDDEENDEIDVKISKLTSAFKAANIKHSRDTIDGEQAIEVAYR